MRVTVASTGPAIRFAKIGIYTFAGTELASALARGSITRTPRRVWLRLRYRRMQAGRFTLFASGEPNRSRSCGPKTYTRVQRLLPCPRTLPVTFPNPPGGYALAYPERVPITLHPRGPVLRDLRVALRGPAGERTAGGYLPMLFGDAHIDALLSAPLQPGRYTALLQGRIDHAPGCGTRSALLRLGFL